MTSHDTTDTDPVPTGADPVWQPTPDLKLIISKSYRLGDPLIRLVRRPEPLGLFGDLIDDSFLG